MLITPMINADLFNFCADPPPQVMCVMPSPVVIPKDIANTAVEFVLRVYLEAKDVLRHKDPLLDSIPFNEEDIAPLLPGCDVLTHFFYRQKFRDGDLKLLLDMNGALSKVSKFHQEKVRVSEIKLDELTNQLSEVSNYFNAVRSAGNVSALIEYYPHLAGTLDLATIEEDNFADTSNVYDQTSKRQTRQNQEMLAATINGALSDDQAKENKPSIYSLSFIQMLGVPPILEEIQNACDYYKGDKNRNQEVFDAIQTVAARFSKALKASQADYVEGCASDNIIHLKN